MPGLTDEAIASIAEQFPKRKTKTPREPRENTPVSDFLGQLFQGRERDFSGVETMAEGSTYDSGADTGLSNGNKSFTGTVPPGTSALPKEEVGARRNIQIAAPPASPASAAMSQGVNAIAKTNDDTPSSGSGMGAPGVDAPAPEGGNNADRKVVVGIGGGEGLTVSVINGQHALKDEDGNVIAGDSRIADTNLIASSANRFLNDPGDLTDRATYQDTRWLEGSRKTFESDESMEKMDRLFSDMGIVSSFTEMPEGGVPNSDEEAQAYRRSLNSIAEFQNLAGLQVTGTFDEDTVYALKRQAQTISKVREDLLR